MKTKTVFSQEQGVQRQRLFHREQHLAILERGEVSDLRQHVMLALDQFLLR